MTKPAALRYWRVLLNQTDPCRYDHPAGKDVQKTRAPHARANARPLGT